MSYMTDLQWTNSPAIRAQLDKWYRLAFPEIDRIVVCYDILDQYRGRDVLLLMKDGTYIWVDEKMRTEKYIKYVEEGILIEYDKNDPTSEHDKGWINKTLEIGYLIYGAENGPMKRIPWVPLQLAWQKHGEDWIRTYGTIVDHEGKSKSCPVPWNVLGEAIKEFK